MKERLNGISEHLTSLILVTCGRAWMNYRPRGWIPFNHWLQWGTADILPCKWMPTPHCCRVAFNIGVFMSSLTRISLLFGLWSCVIQFWSVGLNFLGFSFIVNQDSCWATRALQEVFMCNSIAYENFLTKFMVESNMAFSFVVIRSVLHGSTRLYYMI